MNLIEYFLENNISRKSVILNQRMIYEINSYLENSIHFLPLEEKDSFLKINYKLAHGIIGDNSIFDNYQDTLNYDEKIMEAYPFKRIEVFVVPKVSHKTTIKLSNYNKLSDKVPEEIKTYVYEVIDYFKRNLITNFDGKITFCHYRGKYYVYDIEIKENEIES